MKKKIAVFDFDGTITKGDTLFKFILFSHGKFLLFKGLIINSIMLIRYFTGNITNNDAKEILFSYFFKGTPYLKFKEDGFNFKCRIEKNVRIQAVKKINEYIAAKTPVYIVSASIREWIEPWANNIGIDKVISTEIEVDSNGLITGKFSTPNCFGIEKVNRLSFFLNGDEYIIAYGDSKGDDELLRFANESYYKVFLNK